MTNLINRLYNSYDAETLCADAAQELESLTAERDALRERVQELEAEIAAVKPQTSVEANNDEVICPSCCTQFRAIPQNVQRLMLDAGFEPPFKAAPTEQPRKLSDEEILAVFATCHNGHAYPQDALWGPRAMRIVEGRAVLAAARSAK